MKFLKYLVVFILGFLIGKFIFDRKTQSSQKEEIQVITNGVKNLSKLVVTQGNYSEIYSFSDTKKYFYDYLRFEKKAILSVNASVEIGYDLSKLDVQIDSVGKQIIIHKIPKATLNISPDIKYYDLQESSFNSFSSDELNTLNSKAIDRIKQTVDVTNLQQKAKTRLFEELSKIYQLSKIYGWKVVDNTNTRFLNQVID